MKFSREMPSAVTVRHVEKGLIRIGDESITESVVLFRDSVHRDIVTGRVDTLTADELSDLIEKGPEIIIMGAGWTPGLPPRDLVFALARKGIGFEMMDTPAACRTFNILISEDRDVAAILQLTG
jgi:uncharacterized protein